MMRTRGRGALVFATLGALGFLAGCGAAQPGSLPSTATDALRTDTSATAAATHPEGVRTIYGSADWPHLYQTLPNLGAASDIVVAGEFTGSRSAIVSGPLPMTYYAFTVNQARSLRLPAPEVGSVVTVDQSGGPMDGAVYEIREDPMFVVGTKAVLFLTRNADGSYTVAGGPTGRFVVTGSEARAFSPNGVAFSGTVDELLAASS